MNRLSKKLSILTAVMIIPIMLVVPSASAETAGSTSKESTFCTNLTTNTSKITSALTNAETKKTDAQTKRLQDVKDDEAQWDKEIATGRDKADAARLAEFTKLEAKATTDAQKAAVKAYETTITNAVATRRKAVDDARATFRAGVLAAINSQQTTVNGQVTTFSSAVNSAIATAQASCASNPTNGATIRTTLMAALKSARETYSGDRRSDGTIATTIAQLAQTRDKAIQAANAAFLATTKTARDTLKTAFGSDSSSVTG